MVSGRNPELLIGQQVRAAPVLKEYEVEVISTAYMLIESGTLSAVKETSLPRWFSLRRGRCDFFLGSHLR